MCLFKGVTRELRVVLLLHSANVRVNEVRLLSLGVLRHHSSDCLRQRPSVGGYSSQFAHTLLRLYFAKLLALLVGEPDDATACAPYGARPVASGNLTTSSQVHLVAGASRRRCISSQVHLALTQPDACGVGESTGEQVSFHCDGYGFGAIRDIELSVQLQKMEFDRRF